jgi:hypothetical protein
MVAAPVAGRVEWWWEDALFMAPPALARAAQATPARSAAYLNLLHTMWWDTKAYLFSDADQLMSRDNSFRNTRLPASPPSEHGLEHEHGHGLASRLPADYPELPDKL